MTVAAVSIALVAGGCSHSGGSTDPPSVVSQRYHAIVDPADAGVSATVARALAYVSGSTAKLDVALPPTVSELRKAVPALNGLSAPQPLHGDIAGVARAMDVVITDLNTLEATKSGNVQPAIASLVADSGRVSAAENVVGLALSALTSPTTAPPATVSPVTVPADTTVPATTTTTF